MVQSYFLRISNIETKDSAPANLQELVILAQGGDKKSYETFLKQLSPYIRAAIRRKLGSIVDQEDLTQECLMGIHKNLATYHPSQPIKPWVSAIIRYKLADHFRRLSKRNEQLLGDQEANVTNDMLSSNKEHSYSETSKREAAEVLQALPEKLSRAIELTHLQGVSYSEAAIKEGISEAALRKRISRAFSHIKKTVAKDQEIRIE